jgi:tripartite-type tricarboxylate transporter receptor subunit TctC
MRTTLALCAAALALAACGRPQTSSSNGDRNVTIVVPGANGGSVVVGNQLPANLPAYVKIYPGAKVTASTTSPGGGVLVLESSAAPETVMDFYKQAATSAGLKSSLDSWAMGDAQHSGAHVVMFGEPGATGSSGKSLTATVESKDGATKIGLMYGAS